MTPGTTRDHTKTGIRGNRAALAIVDPDRAGRLRGHGSRRARRLRDQALDLAAVTSTVQIEITLVEFDRTACAIWSDDEVVFVLLYDGELAFTGYWLRRQ